jgi:hypothetical protein
MVARRLAIAALTAAALAAGLHPAAAGTNESRPIAETAPAPISAKELQSFANAARSVFRVRQAYAPKVQAARSEMDARDFIVAAQKDMEGAIRREGMTVARYNDILKLAQGDAALAGRIQELVDKAARKK